MEKKILEFKINGVEYLYTAEINNKDYLDERVKGEKYIHIKCKIFSNNKTESNIIYGIVRCISNNKYLNTASDIEEFVNEIVQSMEISYDKNKFIKNLIKYIKEEYLSKSLDFDRLEDIFNRSLHKNKLSYVFDHSVFIPRKSNIDLDTKVEIYPYTFNDKLYLHIKVSYSDLTTIKNVFEYELINHNYKIDYYKDACAILSEIFDRGFVIPTINNNSVDIMVNMIEYCFNEDLFRKLNR